MLARSGVVFRAQVLLPQPANPPVRVLWSADALEFGTRYPTSGALEYEAAVRGQSVSEVDFWVTLSADIPNFIEIDVEAWDLPTIYIPRSASQLPETDAAKIAIVLACILRLSD